MIRFYLLGGFGNLLFQKLVIIELSKRHEIEVDEFLITENFVTSKLIRWKIHSNCSHFLFDRTVNTYVNNNYLAFLDGFLLYLSKISGRVIFGRFWLRDFIPFDSNLSVLSGYCQCPILFSSCATNLLELSCVVQRKFISESYGVVVHYRGADSVWAIGNDIYYHNVRSFLKQDFIVVTDDEEKAKITFGENTTVLSTTLLSDFSIMLNAKILVVAPSTLSWWAGLLSDKAELVIIPVTLRDKLIDLSGQARVLYV